MILTCILRFGLVVIAIVCELFLSNDAMIIVLAAIGITGRLLVEWQESHIEQRASEQTARRMLREFACRARQPLE